MAELNKKLFKEINKKKLISYIEKSKMINSGVAFKMKNFTAKDVLLLQVVQDPTDPTEKPIMILIPEEFSEDLK